MKESDGELDGEVEETETLLLVDLVSDPVSLESFVLLRVDVDVTGAEYVEEWERETLFDLDLEFDLDLD